MDIEDVQEVLPDVDNKTVEDVPKEAEQAVPDSKRAVLVARLQGEFPDLDFSDDELLFDKINSRYGELSDELEKRKGRDRDLIALIDREPLVGVFLKELYTSEDKNAARILKKIFGANLADVADEDLDEVNRRAAERLKQDEERAQVTALQDENWEKSIPVLKEFCDEKGVEDVPAFLDEIFDCGDKIILSKPFDRAMLEMFYKARTYDAAVEDAANMGRISGRNEKIDLKKREREPEDVPNIGSMAVKEGSPMAYRNERSVLDIGGYRPGKRFKR